MQTRTSIRGPCWSSWKVQNAHFRCCSCDCLCVVWARVWWGVTSPFPPVCNDIVTPRHLFVKCQFQFWDWKWGKELNWWFYHEWITWFINQSMKQRMYEWISQWINQGMNEQKNKWLDEWMDLLFHKYSAGVMNQYISFKAYKVNTCQDFSHFWPFWVLTARRKGPKGIINLFILI